LGVFKVMVYKARVSLTSVFKTRYSPELERVDSDSITILPCSGHTCSRVPIVSYRSLRLSQLAVVIAKSVDFYPETSIARPL